MIPATRLTVTNEATAAKRQVQTNEAGLYNVPVLPPGQYRILVEQDGFRPINRTGIVLEVDQTAEVNFQLEVGEVTEQIEVTANAVQLNTVDASRGQVIDNQRIVDMPLNGRNYNQLALLSAGAIQPPPGSRYGGFSVAGQRVTQNNYVLDGVDNNGSELAGAQRRGEMVQPSIDAIQEFKVQTNAYSAEYGRAMGGVVNVTTKSGTNQLHGTLFEFLRNEKLDAKNFFDPVDRPKPPFKRNQYGFSIGGPLYLGPKMDYRNKIFWFGDYEGTKIRETRTATSTIPTLAMRNGDFSQLLPGETIDDPNTGSPFPNNVIPADRIDPVAQTLINLYPDPQNGGLAANFVNQSPSIEDVKKWDTRIDFIPGAKNNFSWRLSAHSFDRPQALTLPPPAFGGGNDQMVEGINTGATWNRILTPNLLLSVRGAWNFGLFKRDNPAAAGGELLNDKYGIQGANNSIPGGFSMMGITGYTGVGLGAFNPVDRDSQNRQLITNLSWTKGSHNIKTGFNLIRSQNNIFNIRHEIGTYAYNGRFTGDGMADFLLGMASAYTYQTRIQVQLRQSLWAGFINDDWKITPKLTLNMGVRYEFVQPWVDKYDRMGVFDITTDPDNPQLFFAGGDSSFTRAGYHSDKNNFMPRLGLAYKLTDRTVVRAGYGMFYTYMEPYGDALYLIGNPPNAYGVGLSSGANDPAVLLKDGPAAGSLELENATGLTFSSYNRSPSLGYAQQWNFNIQHELGANWLFETGYSGSRGAHLLRRYDGNFSPPGPGNINAKRRYSSASIPGTDIVTSPLGEVIYYNQDGNSFYHALVTKIEKRFSSGFTILGSHTWSKNIGDTCGNAASGNTSGCGFQDLRDLRPERSLDNSDIPQRFVVSGLYELPFGRGKKFGSDMPRALDAVFGGWAVGSIVTHSSGQPYSITIGGNPANTGSHGVVNRPNVNGDPTLDGDQRTLLEDFDTSAFSRQEDYHVGTLGRNTARQRSFFNWDFSALKEFTVTEDVRLQFRFESFHFTNTPRFAQAGNTFGTANFGRITSADTPRNMQFGLKLIW
ncbi:MAG: TonB-dependent receptor [Bryobacterales bacterium]|nr:TonB-dependent receptor [Acidobacteriota bacterium]MCB9383347.1 TonB-dependent receptor [Bryobacterales bacterium]